MKILIIILLFISSVAHAGYEKTSWGMSCKKVMSMYPGGLERKTQNGKTSYDVIRPVAGFSTGLLMFTFSKDHLEEVTIWIPDQGSAIDLKHQTFGFLKPEDSKSIFMTLTNALTTKYGKTDPISEPDKNVWMVGNGDVVILNRLQEENSSNASVGITYEKVPTKEKLTEGL
jgi:hypothetical protein